MKPMYTMQTYKSMRESSYDRTGGNHDSIKVPAGESREILLEGCGIIKHIWTTFLHFQSSSNYHALHLRFEFDNQEPAIEMSVADFFALPTGNVHDINSEKIQVSRTKNHPNQATFENKPYRGAMNCYWEMPFLQSAKITLINHDSVDTGWYYHVDWEQHDKLPEDILYFHATKRSEMTESQGAYLGHGKTDFDEIHIEDEDNYVFCDIQGYEGHYVGLSMMIKAEFGCDGSWWEGDEMFIIDGEAWPPRLHGTGLEDYFGLAYGFRVIDCRPQYGITFIEKEVDDVTQSAGTCCMYRFHIDTPVVFHKSLKFSVEHGHANKTNAFYSSVAYWYGRKIK